MDKTVQKRRMWILAVISLAVAVIITVRFAFLTLGNSEGANVSSQGPVRAERGPIVDREGRLLALQTRLYSVTAWKPDLGDPVEIGALLAEILDGDPMEFSRLLASPEGSRFRYIQRQVTPTQSDRIREMINQGRLPGIGLQEELGRHYPMKEMASHVLGYVGTDNVGLDGIEYAFDRSLVPGVMASSNQSVTGHTVHLTLDMNAQFLVETITDAAWEEHSPDSMMVLVMSAETGEILSWVSRPTFDPNTFSTATAQERMNRPLTMAYEPGSVFKIFTWASFLDNGGIDPTNLLETSGGYNPEIFQRYDIPPITDLANYGTIDPLGVLIYSSNIGSALGSDTISTPSFFAYLKNFGFGAPTGLPLPGESHGLLYPTSRWSVRSKPTISFGQEVGVSAIQMATAATALANGGVLLQPRIVSRVTAADGTVVKDYPRTQVREVITPRTATTILEMMEQTVASPVGTAHRAAVPGLRISAKSGTAQIADPETGTYSEDRYLSSVLALFPTDDPKLIVYVVLENPRGYSYWGGRIAGPIVKDIAETLAPLYGIPLGGNTVVDHPGTVRIQSPAAEPLGEELPDMTGYSKRMLLPYLAREDIRWTINGEGWVVFQFPPPGTPVESGMSVYLELR